MYSRGNLYTMDREKQTILSPFNAEAKYHVASNTCEMMWIQSPLEELGIHLSSLLHMYYYK